MKITKENVIKNSERELIDNITADLDWSVVEEIFKKHHNMTIEEDIEYKQGDLIVHNNQIAYKLDFDIKVRLSVLLDREGNYISITSSGDLTEKGKTLAPENLGQAKPLSKENDDYESALMELGPDTDKTSGPIQD